MPDLAEYRVVGRSWRVDDTETPHLGSGPAATLASRTNWQQPGIRGDRGTTKLEHPTAVEIEPQRTLPSVVLINLRVADIDRLERDRIGVMELRSSLWCLPFSQCWPCGMRTTNPSSSSRIAIWHDRRELNSPSVAKLNMLASCHPGIGVPVLSSQAGST